MPALALATVFSTRYRARLAVFAEIFARLHPELPLFALHLGERTDEVCAGLPVRAVSWREMDLRAPASFLFQFEEFGAVNAFKPMLFEHLRDRHGFERAVYLDSDLLPLGRLDEIFAGLDRHAALLSPHVVEPLGDGYLPPEVPLRQSGVYNCGFLGLRLDAGTAGFLSWWRQRTERFSYHDKRHELSHEQTWLDLVPSLVEAAHVSRDPGENVGPWNVRGRRPRRLDGRFVVGEPPVPLRYLHMSGIEPHGPSWLSKHCPDVRAADFPDLVPLVADYRRALLDAGDDEWLAKPYEYARFSDLDQLVPSTLRALCRRVDPLGERWPDPFAAAPAASFFRWATAPLAFPGGVLHRAALALWEERGDLALAFPDVTGRDLEPFAAWIRRYGNGGAAAFGPPLLAGLGSPNAAPAAAEDAPRASGLEALRLDADAALLSRLDLGRPGALTGWLNDEIGAGHGKRPRLTRLALLIYRTRPDVQRAWPDPLGTDRLAFAAWFVADARREFGLHGDLVTPVARGRRAAAATVRLRRAFGGARERRA